MRLNAVYSNPVTAIYVCLAVLALLDGQIAHAALYLALAFFHARRPPSRPAAPSQPNS